MLPVANFRKIKNRNEIGRIYQGNLFWRPGPHQGHAVNINLLTVILFRFCSYRFFGEFFHEVKIGGEECPKVVRRRPEEETATRLNNFYSKTLDSDQLKSVDKELMFVYVGRISSFKHELLNSTPVPALRHRHSATPAPRKTSLNIQQTQTSVRNGAILSRFV